MGLKGLVQLTVVVIRFVILVKVNAIDPGIE
jgi:hypothetical protein